MTKTLFPILFLLFCCQISFANKVDDLKTDADVERFLLDLNKHSGEKIKDIIILSTDSIVKHFDCDTLTKTWGIKNWAKLDINNDGLTDLLFVYEDKSYIAIDKGNDDFDIISIWYSLFPDCEIATALKVDNRSFIIFHSHKPKYGPKVMLGTDKKISNTDTLTYKFGFLVEHNSDSVNYKIDSISFSTGMCFGTCPVFKIAIDHFGNAIYTAGRFSRKQGKFKSVVKAKDLAELNDIINYIAIKKLNDNYAVDWTDYPTCVIRIKFSDGSVKEINDYGELGTFGLRGLYGAFYNLRTSQKWVSAK